MFSQGPALVASEKNLIIVGPLSTSPHLSSFPACTQVGIAFGIVAEHISEIRGQSVEAFVQHGIT